MGRDRGGVLTRSGSGLSCTSGRPAPGIHRRATRPPGASLHARFIATYRDDGRELRFPGRFDSEGNAGVVLAVLPADHPLCGGSGTDNKVAIGSDRYDTNPLAIQGPGAGVEVTTAALLDDVLKIA